MTRALCHDPTRALRYDPTRARLLAVGRHVSVPGAGLGPGGPVIQVAADAEPVRA